jgi:hypothetical protein
MKTIKRFKRERVTVLKERPRIWFAHLPQSERKSFLDKIDRVTFIVHRPS